MASRPIGAGWAIFSSGGKHCLRVGDLPTAAEPLFFQPDATFTADAACQGCGIRFGRGDAIYIVDKTAGPGGAFHHLDCDQPQGPEG